MTTQPVIKPEWLEMIECCSPKVQMDLIRAIVAWQADGAIPEFCGAKKAVFLIMVRDLDPEAAARIAASTVKAAKGKSKTAKPEPEADSTHYDAESAAESAESVAPQPQPAEPNPDPHPDPAPASAPIRKHKNSPRYFCGRPLY